MRRYEVQRAMCPFEVDADWNKEVWRDIPELVLDSYMGREPEHRPDTRAKMMYDRDRFSVIFRVRDRYVKAVTTEHQGKVCRDSCVELFFTPGNEDSGYFNFEVNCCGIYLFHWQRSRGEKMVLIDPGHCKQIEVAASLTGPILKEIQEPVDWTVEFSMPLDMLGAFDPAYTPPGPGVVWRANLYKCADETSHPHWLTWSPVNFPEPDFHRPESFGQLIIEKTEV